MNYAELQVTRHYSFLQGASSPEELFATAALLGIKALGIADRNSLAGVVRAYEAANTTGVRLLVGCRLDLQCGTSLLVYPTGRAAYGRLCRLLSPGKSRAGKGACHIDWPDVEVWNEGMLAILLSDDIVWPSVFENNRRAILSATLMGCRGRLQSANGVIEVIAEKIADLSAELKRVSGLDAAFPMVSGRGDEAKTGGGGLDSREFKAPMTQPRDIYVPDLHIDTLRLKARNFR